MMRLVRLLVSAAVMKLFVPYSTARQYPNHVRPPCAGDTTSHIEHQLISPMPLLPVSVSPASKCANSHAAQMASRQAIVGQDMHHYHRWRVCDRPSSAMTASSHRPRRSSGHHHGARRSLLVMLFEWPQHHYLARATNLRLSPHSRHRYRQHRHRIAFHISSIIRQRRACQKYSSACTSFLRNAATYHCHKSKFEIAIIIS